ncbi:MAG: nuclear transport factor 2 family protein [Acidobacteriia bacterium]|nr:nuclear transport factor 2 family protein [Terriglobia bacterium]
MHNSHRTGILRAPWLLFLCVCILLSAAGPALAQKQKKDKKKKDSAADATLAASLALPDEQQINLLITDMLAAWQLGDVEKLHTYYADDLSAVSGLWEPPVMGWANYLSNYQRQRARVQQVRMDRQNTLVRVNGATAWACYQWDFFGAVDGQGSSAHGQTTLVFVKRDGRWLIIHNHTSLTQDSLPQAPAAAPQGTPLPAAQPNKPPSP